MKCTKTPWGTARSGQPVSRFTLSGDGMEVDLSDFGALILAIRIRVGDQLRDVALGYETVEQYYRNDPGFGGFVGRNGNRIGGARVVLDGTAYDLEPNDNGNNLHSGSNRSYYQVYGAVTGGDADGVWVEFSRLSPHMEQGFPGNLHQKIRYTLTSRNELTVSYHMVSDQTTVINPTNHCYFNLMGHGSGTVLDHRLSVCADAFLPTDDALIPTGEVRSVEGTPFDFRMSATVGARIDDAYGPLQQAGGYDHNYCFANDGLQKKMARLESPDAALSMEVYSDLCGMQLYAGNFLAGEQGKAGAIYHPRSGICFETQYYPNACNTPGFPSSIRQPGEVFTSSTTYRFTVKE